MSLTPTQFAAHLDATNLRLDSTDSDLCALCDEAAESRFAAVCVYPSSVTLCSSILYNSDTAVGTVIGFPHGRTSLECKRAEVLRAAHDGANEVDIVLNYAAIRAGEKSLAAEEALDLCQTARQSNLLTKIIVETCYLNQQQKLEALQICEAAEAEFIKTSTGFGCAGARLEDVQLFNAHRSANIKIKASGGIKELDVALSLITAGAQRLGVSAAGALLHSFEQSLER
jgi:deoxyribose-phosphate aldolase